MKLLTPRQAAAKTCRRCGARVVWARTEATDRTVRIEEAKGDPAQAEFYGHVAGELGHADMALTGETRVTARGKVPVVHYVREGTGTHTEHRCG